MNQQEFKIKAKDYINVSPERFFSLPLEKKTELIAHHYTFKRRKLNGIIVDDFLKNIDHGIILATLENMTSEFPKRKFFRSIKNINPDILNSYLQKFPKSALFEAISFLKLEDRRKIYPEILFQIKEEHLAVLINNHFTTFGKLNEQFFKLLLKNLNPEQLKKLISHIDLRIIKHFFKKTGLDDVKNYSTYCGLNGHLEVLDCIKGRVKMFILHTKKDFLARLGKRNKKNVVVINRDLFKNMDLLNIKLELLLQKIKLRQRKHITPLIEPLYHDLKLIHAVINLPLKQVERMKTFLAESNYYELDFVYGLIVNHDLAPFRKIDEKTYNRIMQNIFDLFYQNYIKKYLPKKENDLVFKKKIKKLISCRFIENYLEDSSYGDIPFLFQFDTYLDDDGRVLLGYYRKNNVNIEIRPTIKQYAKSFVRFRPRLNGYYDVFKINSKAKIKDFVPVTYQLSNNKFQHISAGYSVACYVKDYAVTPLSFRTYITADSKLYFGKIDGEVVQTLISYLEGATPIECVLKKQADSYLLNVYILNSHTGKYESKKYVRSILLRREKPYFKDITFDFSPDDFLDMDKSSFNNSLRYFKKEFFLSFYDKLNMDQKKEIFERLSSKGETSLMDKIGEDRFNDDRDKLSVTFGEEIESISDFITDRGGIEEKIVDGNEYIEFQESFSRRKTDHSLQDLSDIDDDAFFNMRESARVEEFGFDFTAYPPELTFKIKMEILEKIYESFPQDLRRYIKIHAEEIDEEIQEKIEEIDPRLLDGIALGKSFAVRKDPVKRSFINAVIKLFEDYISYDCINDVVAYLRDSKIKIRFDEDTAKFIVRSEVIRKIQDMVKWDFDKLVKNLNIFVSDI